jgi:apolipoprotein D and lipocalin family protein
MKKALSIYLILLAMLTNACNDHPPVVTVKNVDLKKYMGKWYEIARFPHSFEDGCNCVTAEYNFVDDKYVSVLNSCTKNGLPKKIEGKAFIPDKSDQAKLKVQFFWPFRAKYWIIDLAPDYSWAVVSHPNRNYLWILSRTSDMDKELYDSLLIKLQDWKFDTDKLIKVQHNCDK